MNRGLAPVFPGPVRTGPQCKLVLSDWWIVGNSEVMRRVAPQLNFRTFPDQQKINNLRPDVLEINKKGLFVSR